MSAWSQRFDWDGRREMPADERNALHRLVAAAHAEGRQVHFAGLPERRWRVREAFWCELAAAGVDLITTTRPPRPRQLPSRVRQTAPALATVAHPRPVRRTVAVPAQAVCAPTDRDVARAARRRCRRKRVRRLATASAGQAARPASVRHDRGMTLRDVLRVAPGTTVNLESIDPAGTPGFPKLQEGPQELGPRASWWNSATAWPRCRSSCSRRQRSARAANVCCWCCRRWTAAARTARSARWPAR